MTLSMGMNFVDSVAKAIDFGVLWDQTLKSRDNWDRDYFVSTRVTIERAKEAK